MLVRNRRKVCLDKVGKASGNTNKIDRQRKGIGFIGRKGSEIKSRRSDSIKRKRVMKCEQKLERRNFFPSLSPITLILFSSVFFLVLEGYLSSQDFFSLKKSKPELQRCEIWREERIRRVYRISMLQKQYLAIVSYYILIVAYYCVCLFNYVFKCSFLYNLYTSVIT